MLTADRLRSILKYDPVTGLWEWLPRIGNARFGGPAGTVSTGGYIQIQVDGVAYMAHLLAWLYMTGEWPPRQVDHEDTCRANNRWSNLRLASSAQNGRNRSVPVNNVLGVKCVSRVARPGKQFRARIWIDGKRVHLGYFHTAEAASGAYEKKAREVFGEFARVA